ncbi:MAG: cell division protein FtsK [Deltaproteobacteria bacterium RBG_13_49_15]|nr:MAG: cell division protein FtsK [Deltaproteobacteria bacterium RBG_13_49_15]
MRKEIAGIILFFFVVLTLISLLSYSPSDPSIHNATSAKQIHNLFGLFGAHLSGTLIGLFGLGAFWFPILFLLASIHFFGDHPRKAIILTVVGGVLLVVTTGSLLTFQKKEYVIFGQHFSSGGIVGMPLKSFLAGYANLTGGLITLVALWIIGFVLATGFSLVAFYRKLSVTTVYASHRVRTFMIKTKERREKAKKRKKAVVVRGSREEIEVKIKTLPKKPAKEIPVPKQEVFEFMRKESGFELPPLNLLEDPDSKPVQVDSENLKMQSKLLEKKLFDFGVTGKVVSVTPGPVITTFEYEPAPGIKISKISNLSDDLSLALRAISVRIVAPIPGKPVIGIEIPNATREIVRFKEVIGSSIFEKSRSKLTICLGKDIVGETVVTDLTQMPHLLIAGATGTGKSVALNGMICSMLYKATPDEVKFILIDPKRIELSVYDGIPHLIAPVVTNVKEANNALYWAVKEMERRYQILSEKRARNVKQYNQKVDLERSPKSEKAPERLPYIVVIIDELSDLMMVASRDVEFALMRLAQMARAAGIHLILATQRPSVDVLTGVIKANFPTRLTFQVSSKTDSRTIIDTNGAENLLGSGDMLFLPPGTAKLQRIHGAYISEVELTRISEFLKNQKSPQYLEDVTRTQKEDTDEADPESYDERYDDAVALVTRTRQASISMVQRHLRIGYNRAARIIEMMEKEGIVGPSDGVKPREVLVRSYDDKP